MFDVNAQDYTEQCRTVLAAAQQAGATSADVSLVIDSGFDVTVRKGDVESLTHYVQQGMSVTVFVGQQTGSASTTDLSQAAVLQAIQKAMSIAQFTQEDPYAGLADPDDLATSIPDCDLDHPWDVTPEQAIEMTQRCEASGLAFDARINNSEGASLSTHRSKKCYANSLGFVGQYQSTSHSVNCTLIAEADGKMQRDYDYTYARAASDLTDMETLGQAVGARVVQRLGARSLKTQQTPVVFRADLAAGLLYNWVRAVSGSSIYRKSSFLLDQLNQQIFPAWMNITQLPHLPRGLASRPFDSDGVATLDRVMVQDGVLQNYILSSYSARKLGMKPTGNAGGIQNLVVSNSDLTLPELLREMGTGILVTELIGQGVNIVTGDYSRGAFGFWVENGEIQFPVEGITIAGNLKDMFQNIALIGSDVELRGSIRTGSILVPGMTVAGG